jgi:transcriptional regulator NrdR family protein
MENQLGYVKKRDGRTVPFDKSKISEAIFKAAQSVGGQDRYLADDLAEVVRLYLVREYKGDIPSVEDIQDVVERILIKTGHAKTAKSYILYRQKRARARAIREGIVPEDLSERQQERTESSRDIELHVRRSDNNISRWDKNRVVAALVRETGISENIAEIIVSEVEEEIIASKVSVLSSSLVRELVNAKLVQYGFESERKQHARIGLPLYDVNILFKEFSGLPDTLSLSLGRAVKKEFALNSVFPDNLVEKHLRGEVIIRNVEGIDRCFSANVPLSASEGEYADAAEKDCNIWIPLVEDSLVLRPPSEGVLEVIETGDSSYADFFKLEVPFKGASGKLVQGAAKRKIPIVFRIEDRDEMEQFIEAGEETISGYKVTVSRAGDRSILVLNRVFLNLPLIEGYAEQEGIENKDYLNNLIPLCSETLQKQEKFFSETFAGRELLKNPGSAQETIEIEFPCTSFTKTVQLIDSRFLGSLFDRSLSLVVNVPQTGEDKKNFYSFLFSLMEKVSDYKIAVRVENV